MKGFSRPRMFPALRDSFESIVHTGMLQGSQDRPLAKSELCAAATHFRKVRLADRCATRSIATRARLYISLNGYMRIVQ